jgi:hypothetical protein
MRARSLLLGLVTAATLLTSACGGGSGSKDAGSTTSTTAPTATSTPALPASFDWWAPQTTPLGRGWTIGPCAPAQLVPKSQGKVLCLNNADGRQAVVEHYRFRTSGSTDLNQHAAQFVQDFLADRKAGCGSGYQVEAEPIVPLTLPDGDARRYGFKGGFANAPDTERTVQWAGMRDGILVIVTISAYDPGSCVPNSGQGSLHDLDDLVPAIDRLVQRFGLPPLQP